MLNINYVKGDDTVVEPKKSTIGSAGYDLVSSETVILKTFETKQISTGLYLEISKGCFGQIYNRSSMAMKGLILTNSVGIIDSDYRGEIKCIFTNITSKEIIINKGNKIAQLIITPELPCNFIEKNKLTETKRGFGGFGSTGI